jgi:HD superfamily phosphodiesterase
MNQLKKIGAGLEYYIQDLILNNQGKFNPYHNTNHCITVAKASKELGELEGLPNEDIRTLIITALYHDIHHKGSHSKEDSENITLALEHVRKVLLPEDKDRIQEIEELIKSTEYLGDRFKYPSDELSLPQKILRDADLTSVVEDDWFQMVFHGLAEESGSEIDSAWVKKQIEFNNSIEWQTNSGKRKAERKLPSIIEDLKWLQEQF